jgi:hypothetical protein
MPRTFLLFTIALFTAASCIGQATKRALFLGNSYTAYNNLPQLTANVALSAGDTLEVSSNTPGGFTFEGHLGNATSMNFILQGNWDFVVLQQQSQMPAFPIEQVEVETFPFAAQLNDSILAHNPCAESVFYMTWGRQNGDQQNCANWPPVCTYEGMDDLLRERYMMMAEMNEGIVSPVGVVWRFLRENHPEIELFASDGSHPSPTGSYAAALCFYTSFFRKSPLNATYDYTIDNSHEDIIRQVVHDLVFTNLSEWYIGDWDPIAALNIIEQNNSPYAIVQQSTYADEVYYSLDGLELQPWINDSLFVDPMEPGDHMVELIAGRCGVWDTTSIGFDLVFNSIEPFNMVDLSIYPNPCSNYLHVHVPDEWNDVTLNVYDSRGLIVRTMRTAGKKHVLIDCKELPSGTYNIAATCNKQKSVVTFIVVK